MVLSGLSYSHRAGTARLACEQVFDARTCREMDWIAGKTGTPTFPNDDVSLDELARLCVGGVARTRAEFATCGALRPYKWYAAAYRADPLDPNWTKAIAVLVERNWLAARGASTARAITVPIPRPRSRCRSRGAMPDSSRASRREACVRTVATRGRDGGGSAHVGVRRTLSRQASPTSKTRCGARSCRWATCRACWW